MLQEAITDSCFKDTGTFKLEYSGLRNEVGSCLRLEQLQCLFP